MNKINGYTEDEAEKSCNFVREERGAGKTLSLIFETTRARRAGKRGA